MRPFSIIALSLGVVFVAVQTYVSMATNKTETQAYKVIQTGVDFEIRFYPGVTIATITSAAKSYKELGNSGFQKLAHYIFGGNQEKRQIAMTTPVHMDINDTLSTMSFVMPSNLNKDNLPQPDNSQVQIKNVPDEYVAAIKFGGFASDKDIKLNTEKLATALKTNGISNDDHFRFLGYNPPFQLFGRRNEVIVNVDWEVK
jgi:hypothetical protein